MTSAVDELLAQHITYEREHIHLLTTLYGVVAPSDSLESHLRIAKCLELMKASTLVLDDFLDKSPSRNGIPSLYQKFGAEEAVLLAELLKSSSTIALLQALPEVPGLSGTDRDRCLLLFEDTYRTVCLGQLEEIRMVRGCLKTWSVNEKEYWGVIEKTTAAFIKLPLLLGAVTRHFDESLTDILCGYGLNIGLAYQVRDDVLDIMGEPQLTGKPLGGDIRERKIRLPMIHCLRHGKPSSVRALKQVYEKNHVSDKDIHSIIEVLISTGSVEYCMDKIRDLCLKAVEHLSSIQNGTVVKQLEDIAALVTLEKALLSNELANKNQR
jgi:geranylgeranyl pyrophosphate synthase